MASKLLSNTLPRAAFSKQFVRPLATAAAQTTRTTVLPNGFTVATEENNNTGVATVGVWVNAGSTAETASTNGAANFLQHTLLKNKASAFEKLGGGLTAGTTREQAFYATQVNNSNIDAAVNGLSEIIANDVDNIDAARGDIFKQQSAHESNLSFVTFDHLHAMAFQNEALGRPVVGVKETVEALTKEDLNAYKKDNYNADQLVLVGAGNVDHDALVRLAEKTFGQLANGGSSANKTKPAFTGSEIRLRDDLLPQAHVAFAVEGAPYLSADYFTLAVMSTIIGSWDQNLGAAANLTSRLSTVVNEDHLANSFASFNKGYNNTGLWGAYFVSDNVTRLDDFVHFLQKEWIRLSTTVTASEVERAKQQLQASILLQLDSNEAIAQDIASQVLTTGKRLSADEIKQTIQKITVKDVREAGNKYLWDQEVVVAGAGPIESLTDYLRVRGFMSYNRF
ncbi:unnamed protein product [Cunninghamella blakesleeana]